MRKNMATHAKADQKSAAMEKAITDLIEEINQQAQKMTPQQRERAQRKTLEIAARVRARRGKA